MFIIKSQKAVMELMVNQVFKKHGMQRENNLSPEDKKRLRKVIGQLKADVKGFTDKQGAANYTEKKVQEVSESPKSTEEFLASAETWIQKQNSPRGSKGISRKKKRKK